MERPLVAQGGLSAYSLRTRIVRVMLSDRLSLVRNNTFDDLIGSLRAGRRQPHIPSALVVAKLMAPPHVCAVFQLRLRASAERRMLALVWQFYGRKRLKIGLRQSSG